MVEYLIQMKRFDLLQSSVDEGLCSLHANNLKLLLTNLDVKSDLEIFKWAMDKCED